MRPRYPLALLGILVIIVTALIGVAAFSPDAAQDIAPTVDLPSHATGRAAATVFADPLAERGDAAPAAPDPAPLLAAAALAPEPTTTTSTAPPPSTTTSTAAPVIAATTTTTAPPPPPTTTTTAPPPPPTTTTTAPPPPTTTTTAPPPPDQGGERDVEEWRSLVSEYFPEDMVDDALRVIDCESNGDPSAYNASSGASGLFQFIPSTWAIAAPAAGHDGASPFDPVANVASAWWLVQDSIDWIGDPWWHWSCKP